MKIKARDLSAILRHRQPDLIVEDLSEAFDVCRERNRPIVVECRNFTGSLPHPDATQFKVYPSGSALWAFDGQNPFQAWPDSPDRILTGVDPKGDARLLAAIEGDTS